MIRDYFSNIINMHGLKKSIGVHIVLCLSLYNFCLKNYIRIICPLLHIFYILVFCESEFMLRLHFHVIINQVGVFYIIIDYSKGI
jgi:hypothetical protein